MNDTMDNTTGEDAVIARLRSALDEVAAGVDTTAADDATTPVIALHAGATGRRPGRAWLGVAAATAVLVGAGGWALTQRSAPAATGTATTLPADPTATPVPDTGDAPWYIVGLADAVPGGISTASSDDPSGGFTQSWAINGPSGDTTSLGLLIIDVSYTDVGLPPDQSIYTEIAAPQGTAWLLTEPGSPTSISPSLVWQRTDGTAWFVTQAGLIGPADADGSAFADYVFQVQRGTFNDLLSNPDERAEWVGAGPTNQRTDYTQSYAVGGVDTAIVLGVGNSSPLNALATATGIADTSIAGNRAWRGTQADGETTVVWLVDGSTIPATSSAAAQQWWGILRISPLLADRVDEIVEAVTPVAANVGEPAPVQTTTIPVTDPVAPPASTTAPMENTVRADYPDLSIVSARIVPGPVQVAPAPDIGHLLGQVWRVQGDGLDGLLMMNVEELVVDEEYLAEQGWTTVTALDEVSDGTAWLVDGRTDDTGTAYRPGIVWTRSDGSSWWFGQFGLSDTGTTDWIDLVLSAVPGSGVPVVIADERASLLSVVGPPTTFVSRSFTDVDGGTATLTLSDSVTQLSSLFGAEAITEIEVDGRTGWRAETSLGGVEVYWDAGDGWFATLRFDQNLAGRADEIIAANLVRLDG